MQLLAQYVTFDDRISVLSFIYFASYDRETRFLQLNPSSLS